ncbi:unnamed protein product [Diatraea saccharalis]|uniref:Proteasome assembly chaperone 3 n=1 Tax=Diatraea saccharalis TaxID=40085 RepID=A0A9N9QWY5_9NEOP|nr:unnamed protein product [Diatraea saccharalis]
MELLDVMKNLTIQSEDDCALLFKSVSATIDDTATEIILAEYRNKTLLILSQYEKIGSLLLVEKDQVYGSLGTNNVYTTKVIFGTTGESQQVAGRYLAEGLNITQPLCLFMNLKSYDIETVKACKDIILDIKQNQECHKES